jgi:hypothetical protein
MFETAILILLYNKGISSCKTINTLLESDIQYPNTKLVIWNNGPEQLKNRDIGSLEGLGYDVDIEETLNNESLAVIYNRFLANYCADKYILLDDDSVLNAEYILASSGSKSSEISMPIISSEGKVQSPQIDGQPYCQEIELTLESKVITIGSGLVIGTDIVNNLKEDYNYVFDERFYLYGVDTTFCLRLFNSKLIKKIKIIPGFSHSLSRLSSESKAKSDFRMMERSYDLALTLRYYATIFVLISIIKKLLGNCIGRKKQISFPYVLKAFYQGRHYRDKG